MNATEQRLAVMAVVFALLAIAGPSDWLTRSMAVLACVSVSLMTFQGHSARLDRKVDR
jgi:hypothetical protein